MGSRRVLRGLVALTVLTSLVAACGDDDDDATPAEETDDGATGEVEAQAIDITAVDYGYSEAPTEIDAGLVTVSFKNDGEFTHEAALLEIGDLSIEEFLTQFTPVVQEEGAPLPDVTQHVSSPVAADPGETVERTFTVAEGSYVLLCTFNDAESEGGDPEGGEGDADPLLTEPHFNRGQAQLLTVGPGEVPDLPEADGSITAHDYTFDVDVEAGDETINFLNTGVEDEIHFAALSEYPEGTTEAEALEAFSTFLNLEEGQAPPEGTLEPSDEDFGYTGIFSKGLGNHIAISKQFKSGYTYVVVCFINDRAGGPPHALPVEAGGHGMVKAFTVA